MSSVVDISWWQLGLFSMLLAIPLAVKRLPPTGYR